MKWGLPCIRHVEGLGGPCHKPYIRHVAGLGRQMTRAMTEVVVRFGLLLFFSVSDGVAYLRSRRSTVRVSFQ